MTFMESEKIQKMINIIVDQDTKKVHVDDTKAKLRTNDGKVVVFKGTIYNKYQLACLFKGAYDDTMSDVEVFRDLIVKSLTRTLGHINGSFAFVVIDTDNHIVSAGRDRLGTQPLYYTIDANKITISDVLHLIKLLQTCRHCFAFVATT